MKEKEDNNHRKTANTKSGARAFIGVVYWAGIKRIAELKTASLTELMKLLKDEV